MGYQKEKFQLFHQDSQPQGRIPGYDEIYYKAKLKWFYAQIKNLSWEMERTLEELQRDVKDSGKDSSWL